MKNDSPTIETLSTPAICLRRKEAANALGIGIRKLWELTNRGEIPHIRIGRSVRYPVEALQIWAAAQAKGGRHGR